MDPSEFIVPREGGGGGGDGRSESECEWECVGEAASVLVVVDEKPCPWDWAAGTTRLRRLMIDFFIVTGR